MVRYDGVRASGGRGDGRVCGVREVAVFSATRCVACKVVTRWQGSVAVWSEEMSRITSAGIIHHVLRGLLHCTTRAHARSTLHVHIYSIYNSIALHNIIARTHLVGRRVARPGVVHRETELGAVVV